MPEAIPGWKATPWYRKKRTLELVGSVPPAMAAIAAAFKLSVDGAPQPFVWAAAGVAVWLLGASALKISAAASEDKKAHPELEHEGLTAALYVLHYATSHACGLDPDEAKKQLRVTFHRVLPPIESPIEIEQLVDYVGGGFDGRGRKFSVRSGIAGKSARTGEIYQASRQNDDAQKYRTEMQDVWGYTASDVKKLSDDRFSWMAVPVKDETGTHSLGVVYLDSTVKSLFEEKSRQVAVVVACTGIAAYVDRRY